MPNHRNRRAAKAKARRSTVAVPRIASFPIEVALPPQRGALVRTIDLPLPPAALNPAALASAATPLFAVPARPPAAKPSRRKAPKRKTAKRKSAKPKLTATAATAAIALPSQPEPLVTSGRALVPYRADGLMDQLSHWLTGRASQLWQRLSGPRQTRPGLAQSATKIRQLRAENARLKAQLEALLALQPALPPGARDRALQPLR